MQEVVGILIADAADDLEQIVDKDVGNIVIAGVEAAHETAQGLVRGNVILVGRNQTSLMIDVERQCGLCLNAHDVARAVRSCVVNELDELLGLTRALLAHDQSNHKKSLLHKSLHLTRVLPII